MTHFSGHNQDVPYCPDLSACCLSPMISPFARPPMSSGLHQAGDLHTVSPSCFPCYGHPTDAGSCDIFTAIDIKMFTPGTDSFSTNATATEVSGFLEGGRMPAILEEKVTSAGSSSSSSSVQRIQAARHRSIDHDSLRKREGRQTSVSDSTNSKDGVKKAKAVGKRKERSGAAAAKEAKKREVAQEIPTGYIHVRARRGEATDSHSLAERVRREKIREKMKTLQELVPGCDKVVGKALLLEEIINYVQSLQKQVQFLSMKLASMDPMFHSVGLDILDYFALHEDADQNISTLGLPAVVHRTGGHIIQTMVSSNVANEDPVHNASASISLHEEGPSGSCTLPKVFQGDCTAVGTLYSVL